MVRLRCSMLLMNQRAELTFCFRNSRSSFGSSCPPPVSRLPVIGGKPQARLPVLVELDDPAVVHLEDVHVRGDVLHVVPGVVPPRLRPEGDELLERLLDRFLRDLEPARDPGDVPLGEQLEVLLEDPQGKLEPVPLLPRLDQQAFAEVPRPDAQGIERLHPGERPRHLLDGKGKRLRRLLHRRLQVAVLVDVPDQVEGGLLLGVRQVEQADLRFEVLGKGQPARQGVFVVGAPVLLFRLALDAALAAPALAEVIFPVHPVDEAVVLRGGRLLRRRAGADASGAGVSSSGVPSDRFLEGGIDLQLLPDRLLQLEPGQLQQLDRLLQLGGHHQLLGELQGLSEFQGHQVPFPLLKREAFPQVDLADTVGSRDFRRGSRKKDLPLGDDVRAIAYLEGIPHVMIRYYNPDPALF